MGRLYRESLLRGSRWRPTLMESCIDQESWNAPRRPPALRMANLAAGSGVDQEVPSRVILPSQTCRNPGELRESPASHSPTHTANHRILGVFSVNVDFTERDRSGWRCCQAHANRSQLAAKCAGYLRHEPVASFSDVTVVATADGHQA